MDTQELARKNDKAAKSNLKEELALLEEKIKLATMNNKNISNSDIQEEAIMQKKYLDPQEIAKKKEEAAAVMTQSIERWNSEKEKNEEGIKKIRKRKEERKREMAEEQALLLSMRKEDEAKAAREEEKEEEKIKIDTDHQEMQKKKPKQNFSDQKKFKTLEVQEYEEALTTFIKPFDDKTMDTVQLKEKESELYNILADLRNDKINLSKRIAEQDCLSKNLRAKLFILLDDKASKKGFIDMEKYYPGKKGHSAKMTRKETADNERPQVLANVWEEKFNAWMSSSLVGGDRDEL